MRNKFNRRLIVQINLETKNNFTQIQFNQMEKIKNQKIFQIVWIEFSKIINLRNKNKHFNQILSLDQMHKVGKPSNILWELEQV